MTPDQDRSRSDAPDPARAPVGLSQRFSLGERIRLTIEYHGVRSLVFRALTYPLRFTPLRPLLERRRTRLRGQRLAARQWYKLNGRPVTIVIPSYRDADEVAALVSSLRRTTQRELARIVVADDASGPEHVAALRRLPGVDVVAGEANAGFAANVNRGLAAATPGHDVVVLNSDMIARPGWLESLQYATSRGEDIGVVGGKLLYPDGRIQFAGTVRNRDAPEWFDHRYRFKPADWGPANVALRVLAVSGACMYITRELLDTIGGFDEDYPMAYEDVDFCLRAWQAGFSSMYWPSAELTHLESVTRGSHVGERERASQRLFWSRWGAFFDERDVRTADGHLKVIYVTEDTGIGGGHRDIFEHLNGLHARGHEVELWSLGDRPGWFELDVPVRTFEDYDELVAALAPLPAIKVATWWNTAAPVWNASILCGIPVFFVQDIETSYYADNPEVRAAVIASYRPEFQYMTISSWNRERLRELDLDATLIPPGIDLRPSVSGLTCHAAPTLILALGRTNPLKNFPLTLAAWRRLPEPRPELCLFGIEPELATEPGIRYVTAPSDDEVGRLFSEATVFVQTSRHEGFCLPPLESMATGGAVVCTDAHGNRDFCADGSNCLMPEPDADAVAAAIRALLEDPQHREALGAAGVATAAEYAWKIRLDELERFLTRVATPRRIAASTDAVPEIRIAPRR